MSKGKSMEPNLENKRIKDRYEKILEDGFELFAKNGYKNTSLSDLVEKSGGSLSTIYKYFKNKEGLFKAIVIKAINDFSKELEKKININSNLNLEEFLYKFSELFLGVILSQKSIAFHRLILSEGFNEENKHIGKMFAKDLNSFLLGYLVNFFKKDEKIKKLNDKDMEYLAVSFLINIKEPYFYNALVLDQNINLTEEEKNLHIKRTIEIFLYGIFR